MKMYRYIIEPLTAFATTIKGDTLFGQLCWGILERFGKEKLDACLAEYQKGNPFVVISDPFWHGYLPRPKLPTDMLGFSVTDSKLRKQIKNKQWISINDVKHPINDWHQHLKSEAEIAPYVAATIEGNGKLSENNQRIHNTINRYTNGTSDGIFAPHSVQQYAFQKGAKLDIYVVLDEALLNQDEFTQVLEDCGLVGYGKDATIGLGKFKVLESINYNDKQVVSSQYLTLAPSVLSNADLKTEECYYSVFTRFGKHGQSAVLMGKPFKNPVLMADSAAFITFENPNSLLFLGAGLSSVSKAIPGTVQQGYAPIIPVSI